jgi:hypothetical protein
MRDIYLAIGVILVIALFAPVAALVWQGGTAGGDIFEIEGNQSALNISYGIPGGYPAQDWRWADWCPIGSVNYHNFGVIVDSDPSC